MMFRKVKYFLQGNVLINDRAKDMATLQALHNLLQYENFNLMKTV